MALELGPVSQIARRVVNLDRARAFFTDDEERALALHMQARP